MYAIVDIAGKQYKVSKDDSILAPKLDAEVGKSVTFDRVLLVSEKGKISVGQPVVQGREPARQRRTARRVHRAGATSTEAG